MKKLFKLKIGNPKKEIYKGNEALMLPENTLMIVVSPSFSSEGNIVRRYNDAFPLETIYDSKRNRYYPPGTGTVWHSDLEGYTFMILKHKIENYMPANYKTSY